MPSATVASKKGPNAHSHWKALSVGVINYRMEKPEKRSTTEIDKILQVLSKVSDLSTVESHEDALLDLMWFLGQQDHKSSSVWSIISLLSKWCSQNARVHAFFRDRLRMVTYLTDLLISLPATSKERCQKLLNLIRYAVFGLKITRLENFLIKLAPKILELVEDSDEELKINCFFILTALCKENYPATKFLLSLLTERERKLIFSSDSENPKIQALIGCLNYCLGQAKLLPSYSESSDVKAEARLTRLGNAFCSAYGESDCLQMDLFTYFVDCDRSLVPTDNKCCLTLIQQILLAVDFSDGNSTSNEILFRFIRKVMDLIGDHLFAIDIIVKTLQLWLEGSAVLKSQEALNLFAAVVEDIEARSTSGDNPLDSTHLQNLKLQLDPIVSNLCDLLMQDKIVSSSVRPLCTANVLRILIAFSGIGNWWEIVSARLNAARLKSLVFNLAEDVSECNIEVISAVIKLAKLLAQHSSEWQKCSEAILQKREVFKRIVECLQRKCHPNVSGSMLMVVGGCEDIAKSLSGDATCLEMAEEEFLGDSNGRRAQKGLCSEDSQAVNQVLDKVTKAVEKLDFHDSLAEVLELGDYRLYSQERLVDGLQTSLALADQRIAQQNEQLVSKELEIRRVYTALKNTQTRSQITNEELCDIRQQFNDLQREADAVKRRMKKECGEMTETIASMEKEQAKITSKALKYKEQNEGLQKAIQEHIQVREDLQAKWKSETKANADLNAALEKREERLKKKERQLEEELTQREKLEKEVEAMRNELSSLQTLSKRQEQALAKKDKQLRDQTDEINECRKIQEQIFNLSKIRSAKNGE